MWAQSVGQPTSCGVPPGRKAAFRSSPCRLRHPGWGAASRIVAASAGREPVPCRRGRDCDRIWNSRPARLTVSQRRERMLAIAHPDHRAGPGRRSTMTTAEPRSWHRCARRWARSAEACAMCPSRTWPPPPSRQCWRGPGSIRNASTTCPSPSPTPAARHRASAGGQRCRRACRSACRVSSSTGAVAAGCRPLSPRR